MSRAIKFRAWNKKGKCWITFGGVNYRYENGTLDIVDNDNLIYEQYTGLKDKNGKEIYEGDIVYDIYTGDEVFIVGWDKDKASFMLADTADYPMAYFDEYKIDKDLEVIGNIHENPELIGGKSEET